MQTQTVKDLIELLQEFPLDAQVIVEWEGTQHTLTSMEYREQDNILYFDVEYDE